MNNKESFDNLPFLRVSKPFLKKYGYEAAAIIAELVYWQKEMEKKKQIIINDGYFFYEQSKLTNATGLSKHIQDKAFEKLVKAGILKIHDKKIGIPPKKQYKVDVEAYHKEAIKAEYGNCRENKSASANISKHSKTTKKDSAQNINKSAPQAEKPMKGYTYRTVNNEIVPDDFDDWRNY